jgi:hypothetical protein
MTKINNKLKVSSKPAAPKVARKRKASKMKMPMDPSWYFKNPFDICGAKWPDALTSQSCTMTSRDRFILIPAIAVGTSITHNSGLIIYPNPDLGSFIISQLTVAPTLTDLNAAGTAFIQERQPPNRNTLAGSNGLIRCTGLGLRVTYEGTELQRAGKYGAGIIKCDQTPNVIAGTGTLLDPMSTFTQGFANFVTPSDLLENATNVSNARVEDGVFEAHWRPSKIPQYMALNSESASLSAVAGVNPPPNVSTPLNQIIGLSGQEAGQSALLFVIEGDTTPVASATGNPYSIDIIWHWEYIPNNPYTTIVDIGPSPYDPLLLARIINNLELGPTARYLSVASNDTFPVPGDSEYFLSTEDAYGGLRRGLQTAARVVRGVADVSALFTPLRGSRRRGGQFAIGY